MAQAPAAMASAMPAAAPTAAPDTGADTGPSDDVVVTIAKADDGSYVVYAGDEPDSDEEGGDDASGGDDSDSDQGQPADSIGAALKIALQILTADKSSEGASGNADDQFKSGFDGSDAGSGAPQKY